MFDPATDPLLHLENLRITFRRQGAAPVQAVKGLHLDLRQGESIAIVGESGSGKSATALALARLLPEPAAEIQADAMRLAGHDILNLTPQELRKVRGKDIAYVFQEPTSSLNPVLTVRTQMAESLALHRKEIRNVDKEILHWLTKVGIHEPEKRLHAYPHQLSGGMQQRVMIAMALCCQPRLLIADEPTTALDVTLQRQIMQLLADLRKELGMSLILITHNLGIIRDVADRVVVMYRGEVVETGTTEAVLKNPQHAYTQALLECVPRLSVRQKRLKTIQQEMLTAET